MTTDFKTCKCEICGDVVMDNFITTHMRLSHPATKSLKRRKRDSNLGSQNEGLPVAPAAAESPKLIVHSEPVAPIKTAKERLTLKVARTVVERRFVTARVYEKKGDSTPKPFIKTPVSPSTTAGAVCPKCGISVPPDAIKRHMRLHDARQPVDVPSDGRSESIHAYSGGLPSLGKRAR